MIDQTWSSADSIALRQLVEKYPPDNSYVGPNEVTEASFEHDNAFAASN